MLTSNILRLLLILTLFLTLETDSLVPPPFGLIKLIGGPLKFLLLTKLSFGLGSLTTLLGSIVLKRGLLNDNSGESFNLGAIGDLGGNLVGTKLSLLNSILGTVIQHDDSLEVLGDRDNSKEDNSNEDITLPKLVNVKRLAELGDKSLERVFTGHGIGLSRKINFKLGDDSKERGIGITKHIGIKIGDFSDENVPGKPLFIKTPEKSHFTSYKKPPPPPPIYTPLKKYQAPQKTYKNVLKDDVYDRGLIGVHFSDEDISSDEHHTHFSYNTGPSRGYKTKIGGYSVEHYSQEKEVRFTKNRGLDIGVGFSVERDDVPITNRLGATNTLGFQIRGYGTEISGEHSDRTYFRKGIGISKDFGTLLTGRGRPFNILNVIGESEEQSIKKNTLGVRNRFALNFETYGYDKKGSPDSYENFGESVIRVPLSGRRDILSAPTGFNKDAKKFHMKLYDSSKIDDSNERDFHSKGGNIRKVSPVASYKNFPSTKSNRHHNFHSIERYANGRPLPRKVKSRNGIFLGTRLAFNKNSDVKFTTYTNLNGHKSTRVRGFTRARTLGNSRGGRFQETGSKEEFNKYFGRRPKVVRWKRNIQSNKYSNEKKQTPVKENRLTQEEAFQLVKESDPGDCTGKLICELAAKASSSPTELQEDEIVLLSVIAFNSDTPAEVKSPAHLSYEYSMSAGFASKDCASLHNKCPFHIDDLMKIVRIMDHHLEEVSSEEIEQLIKN